MTEPARVKELEDKIILQAVLIDALKVEREARAFLASNMRKALQELEYRFSIQVREGTIYFNQKGLTVQCCRIILDTLDAVALLAGEK